MNYKLSILLITFLSVLSSFMLVGVYNIGYMAFSVTFILFLICILILNYLSKRKLSFNILSVSLIIAYLLNSFGILISTEEFFFHKILLNIVLLPCISIELTSEFISSGVIYKYIKGFILNFVYKLIGIFEYFRLFPKGQVKINSKLKTFIIVTLLFVLIGLPIVLIVITMLSSTSIEFKKVIDSVFDLSKIELSTTIARLVFAIVFILFFITEYIFIIKLSKTNFENSEIKTSDVVKRYIVYVSFVTVTLLNLFYILFIFIQLKYDIGNLSEYIQANNIQTFSSLAVSRYTELLFVSFINLTIIYFMTRPSLNEKLHKVIKVINRVCMGLLGLSTIAIIYSANARLSLYESGYGFTDLRLLAHSFLIPLVIVTICFTVPILLGKDIRKPIIIGISSLVLWVGIMSFIPEIYMANKLNLEMYKANTIQRYDPTYAIRFYVEDNYGSVPFSGNNKNNDGLLVLMELQDFLKTNPTNVKTITDKALQSLDNNLNDFMSVDQSLDFIPIGIRYDYNTRLRDKNLMYELIERRYNGR